MGSGLGKDSLFPLSRNRKIKMIKMKKCSKCKEIKAISDFNKSANSNDNYSYWCKQCMQKWHVSYYKINKGRIKAYCKKWNIDNRERLKARRKSMEKELKEKARQYYINNCERIKARVRKYTLANKEKISNYQKKHYQNNKGKYYKSSKEWAQNNKEKVAAARKHWVKNNQDKVQINNIKRRGKYKQRNRQYFLDNKEKRNKYRKEYRNNNPSYKLNYNISGAIRQALGGNKNKKHWETLVNYTLEELKQHLKKQFRVGMSWSNYGTYGWHIDHIIPISLWEFESYEDKEFKQCWALCNLQPLWARENLQKGNQIESRR